MGKNAIYGIFGVPLAFFRSGQAEAAFAQVVREHREVERYHDLRSIVIDEEHTVLVAEVELREEVMIPGLQSLIAEYENRYLDMVPVSKRGDRMVIEYCKARAAAQATIERTETVIEELEAELTVYAPQVSHVTIEVEGIATSPDPDLRETAYA